MRDSDSLSVHICIHTYVYIYIAEIVHRLLRGRPINDHHGHIIENRTQLKRRMQQPRATQQRKIETACEGKREIEGREIHRIVTLDFGIPRNDDNEILSTHLVSVIWHEFTRVYQITRMIIVLLELLHQLDFATNP